MRLSVLALFIALPAAVYAGPGLPVSTPSCLAEKGSGCGGVPIPCCPPMECGPLGQIFPIIPVCFMAHFLQFALGTKLNTGL